MIARKTTSKTLLTTDSGMNKLYERHSDCYTKTTQFTSMFKSIKHTHVLILFTTLLIVSSGVFAKSSKEVQVIDVEKFLHPDILYTGPIHHIFFHSLLAYPELTFTGDKRSKFFESYMITKYEFTHILDELYTNNYVLIDIHQIYAVDVSGHVIKKDLYLPQGKKPLIISVDDVNYYKSQQGRGMAHKLVLDTDGSVATQIMSPNGTMTITHDGDIMPILDTFVQHHPDFSIGGAKGIIAETGFDGVLGYRTQRSASTSPTYIQDRVSAKEIVAKLKATGWTFASHSYTHDSKFLQDTISTEKVERDATAWDNEVKPIIGNTDIFIGPFGEIFTTKDPRRDIILSHGFKMICGVGMDAYLKYSPNYIVMDRANIDGIRLEKYPNSLKQYFDVSKVLDPKRPMKL